MTSRNHRYLALTMAMLSAVWVHPSSSSEGYEATLLGRWVGDYAESFPEIRFLLLRGPEDLDRVFLLKSTLGRGASNLDYEHDEGVRDLLLDVQLMRVATMVAHHAPSATLFRTGYDSRFDHSYVCVITLDEAHFLGDSHAATRFMTGDLRGDVRQSAQVDGKSFLRFSLDHEVFHCLDAYLFGPPRKKTYSELTAAYQEFRTEFRADLFATLRMRQSRWHLDEFLRAITDYRALSLAVDDSAHYTTRALDRGRAVSERRLAKWSAEETAWEAGLLADISIPTRDAYAQVLGAVQEMRTPTAETAPSTLTELDEVIVCAELITLLQSRLVEAVERTFVASYPLGVDKAAE